MLEATEIWGLPQQLAYGVQYTAKKWWPLSLKLRSLTNLEHKLKSITEKLDQFPSGDKEHQGSNPSKKLGLEVSSFGE